MTARELPPSLTQRERAALRLVAHGFTMEEMAAPLGVTARGARYYVDTLKRKFKVDKKRELIDLAYRFGFMDGNGKPQRKEG